MRGLCFCLGLLVACSDPVDPPPKQGGAPISSSPLPMSSADAASGAGTASGVPGKGGTTTSMTLADGSSLSIKVRGDGIHILGSPTLLGERDGRKRKYRQGGKVVTEVRLYPDGGFKIRRPDATGVWRVRRDDSPESGGRVKVKRVVDEKSVDYLEARPVEDGWTVFIDGIEVGRVSRGKSAVEVATSGGDVVATAGVHLLSGSLAVWLSPEMDEHHRRILLAESLASGF